MYAARHVIPNHVNEQRAQALAPRRASSPRSCSSPAPAPTSRGTSLSLVAYSTPKPVMAKLIPAWQATPDGLRRLVQPVLRPLDEPGEGGDRGPAGRHRLPLDGRRRQPARRRRPRQPELGPPVLRRDRREHGRRLRGAKRQPEAHQGLGRPDQARRAGRDAEPVQLRLGEVERPRRLRRRAQARQDRRPGDRVRPAALQARRLAGHVGVERDEHVPLRQGRRADHLRERGDQRAPSGQEHRST